LIVEGLAEFYLWLWPGLLLISLVIYTTRAAYGVGLISLYLALTAMQYWPGALVQLTPGITKHQLAHSTTGFVLMTNSLLITVVIALLTQQILTNARPRNSAGADKWSSQEVWMLFIVGFVLYYFSGFLTAIPTISGMISTLSQLMIVAPMFGLHLALKQGNYSSALGFMAVTFLQPLLTLSTAGFLGFGSAFLICVLVFASVRLRLRFSLLFLLPVAIYIGLSVGVTYFRDRAQLRMKLVDETAVTEDVSIRNTFQNFEWVDVDNQEHRFAMDDRLNQSWIVGATDERMASGAFAGFGGQTLVEALIGLVPRIIWPDKPITVGSGTLVTQMTGEVFGEGTSVGTGPIAETLANFGRFGLWVYSLLFGIVLGSLDWLARRALDRDDLVRFALVMMPALALMNVLGSYFALVSAFVLSFFGAIAILLVVQTIRARRARREPELQLLTA
jgi:hypothetical protein